MKVYKGTKSQIREPTGSTSLLPNPANGHSFETVSTYVRFGFSGRWGWWCHSSKFLCCVDSSVDANISEKHTVSIFRAEDGDNTFLWNAGIYQWVYMAPKPRRTPPSVSTCLSKTPPFFFLVFQMAAFQEVSQPKSYTPFLSHPNKLQPILYFTQCFGTFYVINNSATKL
jgi:hypothetical protein